MSCSSNTENSQGSSEPLLPLYTPTPKEEPSTLRSFFHLKNTPRAAPTQGSINEVTGILDNENPPSSNKSSRGFYLTKEEIAAFRKAVNKNSELKAELAELRSRHNFVTCLSFFLSISILLKAFTK